jgi:hypothetical protein
MTYYNHSVQNRPSGLLRALGFLQGTEDSMRIGLCIHGIQVTNVGDLCEISPWATRKARTHSQTVARRNLVHGIDRLNWPVLSDCPDLPPCATTRQLGCNLEERRDRERKESRVGFAHAHFPDQRPFYPKPRLEHHLEPNLARDGTRRPNWIPLLLSPVSPLF